MKEKPLVALLTNNDDDVYCFRLELVQTIISEGYSILISCPNGPKFEAMEELGLYKEKDFFYDDPPIDRRGTSVRNDVKLILHYLKLFKKYTPSVILTYTAKPNVYASLVAKQLSIPVINNVTGLGSVVNENGLKKVFIMWLFRKAYRSSSCMMFQNSMNMKLAEKLGWIKGKRKLIPGSGVSLDRYPVQPYPEGGDGKTGATIVFNYIGRIMHDKGVDDYLEASKRIKMYYPNTEFNLLGFIEPTESHYEQILKQLQEQGIVLYRGSLLDVKPWICRSHAVVHPSIYGEGMSNVLLENASSGRPIITTDNPGCRETVVEGKSGFIFEGGKVDALIEQLELFLSLPNSEREKMGLYGRKHVSDYFSRSIVIREYMAEIKKLIG